MPPSYSVRRGRLTAQIPCRTGTSYTPVKHTHLNIFTLIIRYSLFTNSAIAPYTLILKNHLGAPARTTSGCSEIIESRPPHAQHLATTQAHSIRTNPNKIIVNPVKNFALLATTFTQILIRYRRIKI